MNAKHGKLTPEASKTVVADALAAIKSPETTLEVPTPIQAGAAPFGTSGSAPYGQTSGNVPLGQTGTQPMGTGVDAAKSAETAPALVPAPANPAPAVNYHSLENDALYDAFASDPKNAEIRKELNARHMMQSAFTQKTQALADKNRQLEALKAQPPIQTPPAPQTAPPASNPDKDRIKALEEIVFGQQYERETTVAMDLLRSNGLVDETLTEETWRAKLADKCEAFGNKITIPDAARLVLADNLDRVAAVALAKAQAAGTQAVKAATSAEPRAPAGPVTIAEPVLTAKDLRNPAKRSAVVLADVMRDLGGAKPAI